MEHSYINNNFVDVVIREMLDAPKRLVWAGDYADDEPGGETLYSLVGQVHYAPMELTAVYPEALPVRWVLNHDSRTYVDLHAVPDTDWGAIHPLPLLTAEGNGRGGGDFRGENPYVGQWARDLIQVLHPTDRWSSTGWIEIQPEFTE